MGGIDRAIVKRLLVRERKRFAREHLRSRALFARARRSLLAGVPMNWMVRWAGPFPIFVTEGRGAQVEDVDGHRYLDLCLGDTGSMFGHSPKPVVEAVKRQARKGITMMLPTEDSLWVGEELSRRFGLPYWQMALTATDANRFALRLAREVTGRRKILVFNGCYHGTVDETLVDRRGSTAVAGAGNVGPPVEPSLTTKVVEFNDVDGLDGALSPRDVACVLAEPAMTNRGIILPQPGYHEALRRITRHYGTLLLIDETHTLCCGPGGYTAAHRLKPDMVTLGKSVASGVPAAAFGVSRAVADRVLDRVKDERTDESGIGGTLSGNALAMAAMRATLEHVITPTAFQRMFRRSEELEKGIVEAIRDYGLPWHAVRLGCRVEYRFMPLPPRNGWEAEVGRDPDLDRLMHLYALNRGILLTPFHNMALVCPYTTKRDIDHHTEVFREAAEELVG